MTMINSSPFTRSSSQAGPSRTVRGIFKLLDGLPHGVLDLQLPDGSMRQFGVQKHAYEHSAPPLRATLVVSDWDMFSRTLQSGDIGFAESFIDGQWHSPDLAALLRLMVQNRDHVQSMVYGTWWGALLYRLRHYLNRNSKAGSQKNIHAHYDIGNDFYRLWLDPGMNYSSAWFEGQPTGDLVQAQQAKMRRALVEVGAGPGTRVLEVGCGWGALAEMTVKDFGAHVKGVTLSTEQLAWARKRLSEAGLADGADLCYQDYRDLAAAHGKQAFDAIVSIEMFEAVGQRYWPDYFDMLKQCLKPDGKACIQTITIRDDLFERYAKSTDFIQQYIFPGGMLPSIAEFTRQASRAGLVVERQLAFGPDYAETLRRWRTQFTKQDAQVRQLAFDTRFIRTWDFYLAYCEAAFDEGNTNVVQFTLRHAG
jgi:cyclopropane-fatty-acyl-phospholipid synthase